MQQSPLINQSLNLENLELMDAYLHNLSRLNKSEHTIKNYRADLIKFFSWIQHLEKSKITKTNGEMIGRYKEFLSTGGPIYSEVIRNPHLAFMLWFKLIFTKKTLRMRTEKSVLFFQSPMSVSSRRRHLSSLKNFFQYLKEVNEDSSEKFSKNPVKSKIHAIQLKDIDITPTKMLSREEFKLIEEKTFRTKEKLMLYLLYYGGLRLSELCYLKISNFDTISKVITFTRKGGSIHTLVIQKDDLIFKNLDFYLSQNQFISDFLFQNKVGKAYSLKTFYNQIMKIILRAEVTPGISPHSFRKACATNIYIKTKDLLYVRDYLNHADAKVTQSYIDKGTLSKNSKRLH
ncbi:MAG: tyrosine-type recombinase/integrase [Bacteriovorax sp.]|nr:tyrosine-type recombinase/integrase [Bacteriovorax sp.]